MRIGIEIDRWEDLIVLKELLNGNGLIKLNEDLPPQMGETADAASTPTPQKAPPRKAAQKTPEKPKEEQTAGDGTEQAQTTAYTSDEAAAGPVDQSNPFADDVIEEEKPAKPKKLSQDDVAAAFKKYIDVFGQAAAMQDVSIMLQEGFGVKAISKIPSDQDARAKAVVMVADAIEQNRFNREKI